MRRPIALFLLLWAAACGGAGANAKNDTTPPPAANRALTPAEIADRALPSVVLVKTPIMIGTGFVVWQDGRVATNLHVIAGAKEATILLNDGRKFDRVEVLAADPEHDLVILRIPVVGLKPLALADSTLVKPGQHVVAIGHPLGMGNTVSDGLVSGVRKIDPKVTLLQISAPISPGSSGGPIFNERAEVVGVATMYSSEGQNLNFGVPAQYLKPMLLAERGQSLAAFAAELETALFDGCSSDEIKTAVTEIGEAIKLGAPVYNKGDHKACYDIYEKTALHIVGSLQQCQGVRETLLGGVSNANKAPDPTDKAWAMRHAFDRILSAFESAVNNAEKRERQPQQQPPAPNK